MESHEFSSCGNHRGLWSERAWAIIRGISILRICRIVAET